jgi:hypothetical protein
MKKVLILCLLTTCVLTQVYAKREKLYQWPVALYLKNGDTLKVDAVFPKSIRKPDVYEKDGTLDLVIFYLQSKVK